MFKIYIALICTTIAVLANTISIDTKVENEIITNYDIQTLAKEKKISFDKSRNILINKLIKKIIVKKLSTDIDNEKIINYITKIANSQNMSLENFRQLVKRQTPWNEYKNKVKQQMLKSLFTQKAIATSLANISQKQYKEFYEKNKIKFKKYKSIKVIKYQSILNKALKQKIKNPLAKINNIKQSNEILKENSFENKNIYNYLTGLKNKTFSQIIPSKNSFIAYFIIKKKESYFPIYSDILAEIKISYAKKYERKLIKDFIKNKKTSLNIQYLH